MDALKDLHSEETERAALGCMLLDRGAAALGKTMLLAEDFYTPMYRMIFEAMQGVEEIDAVTVMNELARRGEAERIGLDRIAGDRKSTRLNSSHNNQSRMPSSA